MGEEYRIITRAEWGAKPPKGNLDRWGSVTGWVQHWAGVYIDPTKPDYTDDIRAEQAYHQNKPGVKDILYNFLVCPNGQIFEGRGWDYRSAANGNTYWNGHGFAVQYHGGPSTDGRETPLTEAGKGALRWLYREALARFPVMVDVKGHRDVRDSPTACPGDVLMSWLPQIGEDGDTDMALSIEDKNWIQQTIKDAIEASIGSTAAGAPKTVHEACKAACRQVLKP